VPCADPRVSELGDFNLLPLRPPPPPPHKTWPAGFEETSVTTHKSRSSGNESASFQICRKLHHFRKPAQSTQKIAYARGEEGYNRGGYHLTSERCSCNIVVARTLGMHACRARAGSPSEKQQHCVCLPLQTLLIVLLLLLLL
jgi:hypothetical protein